MPKTLDDLNEWAVALRKEEHPLAETMEEIAEGWREGKESSNSVLLAHSRKEFWEQYQNGKEPPVLTDYRKYRDSEEWRTSRTVEQLCEIILKLEEQKESRDE